MKNYQKTILVGLFFFLLTLSPVAYATQTSFTKGIDDAVKFGRGTVALSGQTFHQLLFNIGTWLLGLVTIIALVAIVYAAIVYITSLGDEARIARAKKIILAAIIGVLIAGLNKTFEVLILCELLKISNIEQCGSSSRGILSFYQVILNLGSVLVIPAGALAFAVLVIAGYFYITSAGDESKASRAKRTILYAIIGLIVIGVSGIIVNSALSFIS